MPPSLNGSLSVHIRTVTSGRMESFPYSQARSRTMEHHREEEKTAQHKEEGGKERKNKERWCKKKAKTTSEENENGCK